GRRLDGSARRRRAGPLDSEGAGGLEACDRPRFHQDLAEREARLFLTLDRRCELFLGDVAVLEQDLTDRALRRGGRGCRDALHPTPPLDADGDRVARGVAPRGEWVAASMLDRDIGTPSFESFTPLRDTGHEPS